MDYLFSVADKIHRTNLSFPALFTVVKELWVHGADYGYQRRIHDGRNFKDKREIRRKRSFDMALTNIDNLIHNKNKR